jgi:hypothetical protein
MTGMIKTIKISLCVTTLILIISCAKDTSVDNKSTISNIPAIVKALEALGNTDKKNVDKEDKK